MEEVEMEKLFTFGVWLVVIGVIIFASSLMTLYYMSPVGIPKLITIFIIGAGTAFISLGFVCVIISMVFRQAVRLGIMGLEKVRLTPSIFLWSILMVIIIVMGMLVAIGRVTEENFMQVVTMIIGMITGGAISFAIQRIFGKA